MKLTNVVQKDILAGNVFAPSKKEWAQFIPVALSVASSLIGGHKAGQAAREAKKAQKAQEAREDAWYNRNYHQDYLDTAAGANLLRKAQEHAKSQWKKAEGAKAVGGGTEAGAAMAKEAGNKMVGDTIANIAANDVARKDRVDAMHRNAQEKYTQMDMNRELNRAQNITQAAQNMSNAMMSVASTIDGAKSQVNTSNVALNGSSNGGIRVNSGVSSSSTGGAVYNGSGVKIYDPDAEWIDV